MKSFLRRARDLMISSTIFISSTYGYLYYTSQKNKKEYIETLQADTLKDASRLTNQSFGISWGFQADDTIMDQIDSGDLLFIKFDCSECLDAGHMFRCYKNTVFDLEEQFHTVGFAFRDQDGLQILYNEFDETKMKSYAEFVSLPYLKQLTLQKSEKKNLEIHKKLKLLLDKEIEKPQEESSIEFVQRISGHLGNKRHISKMEDLIVKDDKVNIRTQTNRTLRSL